MVNDYDKYKEILDVNAQRIHKLEQEAAVKDLLFHLEEYEKARELHKGKIPPAELAKIKRNVSHATEILFSDLDPEISEVLRKENPSIDDLKEFKRLVLKTVEVKTTRMAQLRTQIDEIDKQKVKNPGMRTSDRDVLQAELDATEIQLKPYLASAAEMAGKASTFHNIRMGMARFVEVAKGIGKAILVGLAWIVFGAAKEVSPGMDPTGAVAIASFVKGGLAGASDAAPTVAGLGFEGVSKGQNAVEDIQKVDLDDTLNRVVTILADEEELKATLQQHQAKKKIVPHIHEIPPRIAKAGHKVHPGFVTYKTDERENGKKTAKQPEVGSASEEDKKNKKHTPFQDPKEFHPPWTRE